MLEAKDTVVIGDIPDFSIKWHGLLYPELEPTAQQKIDDWVYTIRLHQAKLSFKAGEDQGYKNGSIDGYNEATRKAIISCNNSLVTGHKLGIREVVEWFRENAYWCPEVDYEKWQNQLKDWGL